MSFINGILNTLPLHFLGLSISSFWFSFCSYNTILSLKISSIPNTLTWSSTYTTIILSLCHLISKVQRLKLRNFLFTSPLSRLFSSFPHRNTDIFQYDFIFICLQIYPLRYEVSGYLKQKI